MKYAIQKAHIIAPSFDAIDTGRISSGFVPVGRAFGAAGFGFADLSALPLPVQQAPHGDLETTRPCFPFCTSDNRDALQSRSRFEKHGTRRIWRVSDQEAHPQTTHIGRSSGPMIGGAEPARTSSKMLRARNGTYTPPTKPYKPPKYTATETLFFHTDRKLECSAAGLWCKEDHLR